MTIEATPTANARTRAAPRQCCADCPPGARNNYFVGKRMPPQSYVAEQRFLNGRRHVINRAVLGWGVVYGFPLATGVPEAGRADQIALKIGEGLALDIVGRELWQPDPVALTLDNLVILDDDGKPLRADGDLDGRFAKASVEACWLLSAHYAERLLDPVTLKDDCGCPRTEWDRTCETIVYTLRPIDCAACCAPYECGLDCECAPDTACCGEEEPLGDGDTTGEENPNYQKYLAELRIVEERFQALIDEAVAKGDLAYAEGLRARLDKAIEELRQYYGVTADVPPPKSATLRHARGGCTCLCEHLTKLPVGADCVRLVEIGDCTRADLDHGVALGCIGLGTNECGRWTIREITDACGPRRLVKRNDLLFDLINGCDVTRIDDTGWKNWHRVRDSDDPVPFKDFAEGFGWIEGDDAYSDHLATRFWVHFSRPVRKSSLKPDCFVIGVMTEQTEGCWREYYRVPIVGVQTENDNADSALTSTATIVVDGDWVSDGLVGRGSIFQRGPTYVEITVRGDFIVDCLGQTVDANLRGLLPVPTGGDGPGDDYTSTFTVAQREPDSKITTATRRRPAAASSQGAET